MKNLSIGLDSYQQAEGGGIGTMEDVMLLKKALEIGYIPSVDTPSTGDVLKVQSLEKTMKNLEYKEQDIAFWLTVPKLPAFSTSEEYNRLISYGEETGGFFNEGGTPEEVDSLYQRAVELVKYIGITKSVTHQAQLVSTNVGDLQMHASQTGTKWVLRRVDRALPNANADVVPEEFNGFVRQQRAAFATLDLWDRSKNVVDMRGKTLKENDVEDGSETILNNNGIADTLIAAPAVLTGFVKQYRESKFIQPNTEQVSAGRMGQRVKIFESQFSTINLGYDKFLAQRPRQTTMPATHAKAPATPTPDGVAPVTPVADALGLYLTDYAGDYFVGVAAINRYGESPIVQLGAGLITIGDDESIDCKFSQVGGQYAATGFVIYRSEKNPVTAIGDTPMYPVATISVNERAIGYDGAAAGLVRDRNRTIPNTFTAFLVENDLEVWSFKQLAPVMKMDIARLGTADRFMVLLYGTPHLYAPKKMVIYKNVGRTYVQ